MTKRVKILLMSGMGLLLSMSLAALITLFPADWPAAAEEAGAARGAAPDPAPAVITEAPEAEAYVLRDLDGYIAVYRLPEIGPPDILTEINTRTLRRADYLSLQNGIRVEGWENLQKALEDFGP